ncbi:MAG TPA: aldo/keto reductase family protein [Candidatus Eremiobacteraceae bacterium]|nr:aldo/keto reductase family protein [Candidatus Eremiobacteraceae bacterium]
MRYRNLGRWGIRVSEVALGSWLTYGGSVESETAAACIKRAYDKGVTLFDTANAYGRGRAEEVVGRALRAFPRDSFVLATKVFFPMGDGPNDHGLSRKHVFEQCHRSLERLGVDYIDLYQCHRYDIHTPLEETCRVMDDLIRQGKVLYWGVSEWTADQISHAVTICTGRGWSQPVSNQPQYSALWRRIEAQVLPMCASLGIGSVVWSPLAMGVLTGKYVSVKNIPSGTRAAGESAGMMDRFFEQDVLDAVQKLKPIAQAHGASIAQLALAWCLRQHAVSSVIVGATKIEQVDENMAASDLNIGADAFAEMGKILAPVADA